MPVPKQVEEQGKKADDLLKELYPERGQSKEEGAKSGEAADPPVKEGVIVEPKPKVTETPPATDLEKEQHKYSVLKGKYDTEVNDVKGANEFLTKQLMQLKAQNEELNTLIIDMKKKIDGDGGAPAAKTKPEADVLKLLSQDEIDSMDEEGLTPEVLKLIGKLVGRVTEGRAEKSETKTSNLEQEVNVLKEERIKTAEEKFYEQLKARVDDWETINNMPDFRTWLSERMPGTNFQRQAILDDSQARLDVVSVIEMFNEFKRAHDIKVTQPKPETPKPEIPKKDLAGQVDPVTTSPSTGPSTEGKVFTNAEIRKFYSDMAKGVYKNTPEVAKQKEAEILSASIDGRITQ